MILYGLLFLLNYKKDDFGVDCLFKLAGKATFLPLLPLALHIY